jgi:oligopeptide transport system substrate-binding protein
MQRKIIIVCIFVFSMLLISQSAFAMQTPDLLLKNSSSSQIGLATTQSPALTPTSTKPPKVIIPISKMAKTIPWLPYDKAAVPCTTFIGINVSVPPFDNVLVRKAFSLAVDRQRVVDGNKTRGILTSVPATTFIPAEVLGLDFYKIIGYDFDLAAAKQTMIAAGFSQPSSLPAIKFVFYKGSLDLAKAYQEMWKNAFDIEVQLVPVNSGDELYHSIDNNESGLFILGTWIADEIDPHNFLNGLFIDKNSHYPNFKDQKFVDLIDQAQQKASQPAERQQLYIQAQKILNEEGIYVIPVTHFTMKMK